MKRRPMRRRGRTHDSRTVGRAEGVFMSGPNNDAQIGPGALTCLFILLAVAVMIYLAG